MGDESAIGFLKADVARFCAGPDGPAPAVRLRLVVQSCGAGRRRMRPCPGRCGGGRRCRRRPGGVRTGGPWAEEAGDDLAGAVGAGGGHAALVLRGQLLHVRTRHLIGLSRGLMRHLPGGLLPSSPAARRRAATARRSGSRRRPWRGPAGPVGAGAPVNGHPHGVGEVRWIRAEDVAVPVPVRYRPTAAAYVAGEADKDGTRTRGALSALPSIGFGRCSPSGSVAVRSSRPPCPFRTCPFRTAAANPAFAAAAA
ncbi:hypothetical protein STXM2123_5654 [Streptomyces sp. F-3]|nr:hypothetical protein STXM2123_5654 [Streptomyces sp. F-3]